MKEHKDIQFLFEKAANEPVQISYDETQKAFTSALSSSGLSSGSKNFWAKNWILMISTALTLAVGAGLWFFASNGTEKQSAPTTSPATSTEQSAKTPSRKAPSKETPAPERTTKHITPNGDPLQPKPLQISRKMSLQPVSLGAVFPLYQQPTRKAPYRFPKLTEEEKKANEKRKKEMVKNFVKLDKHSYVYIPSASIHIDTQVVSIQAFYMQKHEVTNIQYKTFLFDLLIKGRKDDFLVAKPDQEKWVEHYGEGMRTLTNTYFSEEAYDNYPVVNVSRKGAEMYCKWLSEQVHAYTEKRGEPYMNDIRLPQRKEWVYAAGGGDTTKMYPLTSDSLKNEKGYYLANFLPEGGMYADDGNFHTIHVDSYSPNTFGLYNMAGNAAEMVYESEVKRDLPTPKEKMGTAGGSWENGEEALRILGPDPYRHIEDGHPAIGFRVVATHLKQD